MLSASSLLAAFSASLDGPRAPAAHAGPNPPPRSPQRPPATFLEELAPRRPHGTAAGGDASLPAASAEERAEEEEFFDAVDSLSGSLMLSEGGGSVYGDARAEARLTHARCHTNTNPAETWS